MMQLSIIDYGSSNLHSVAKAFERTALDHALSITIQITKNARDIRQADYIVLPGVGAYKQCRDNLYALEDMIDTLELVALKWARPFLGICVGMQLFADYGFENSISPGLGWIGLGWIQGKVIRLTPTQEQLKIPHIGWNRLTLNPDHAAALPLFQNIATGPSGLHAYFVHSYHFVSENNDHCLATTEYGGKITAAIAHNNLLGTQFHPEKSQQLGLQFLANFLKWRP